MDQYETDSMSVSLNPLDYQNAS